jgi:hypothetical protein
MASPLAASNAAAVDSSSSTDNRGGLASPSSLPSTPSEDAWLRSLDLAQPELRALAR